MERRSRRTPSGTLARRSEVTNKPRRGLFVGRFQPFHLGHLGAIKTALERVQELIIVVGSAEYSHSDKNPFTAGERVEMILAAMKEANIDSARYVVIPVRDVHINAT